MPFPANQVMKYFHVFISLLMAICLAAVHVMASHQAICIITLACQVPRHVSCVPQQTNSRQNDEFRGYHVESLLCSLLLSSVHSMIVITNTLINQAESYRVLHTCNYQFLPYLGQKPVISRYTNMISLLLHSTLTPPRSCVISMISSL